jgi:DNA-binding CsgD family transcriptional regulator
MMDTEKIIDDIYEASVVPEHWNSVLESLGDLSKSAGGTMVLSHAEGYGNDIAAGVLVDVMDDFMQSDIRFRTQTTARLIQANHPGFLTDEEVFSPDIREQDPLFKELLQPHGIGSSMGTAIGMPTGDFALFLFVRKSSEASFDSKSTAPLDALRPHLARATMLSTRLRLQRLRAAAETLAIIGLAAAILSPQGRVLVANDLLQAMDAYVIWAANDRIALRDASANAFFASAVGKLQAGGRAESHTFLVSAANGRDAAVGHLIPIAGSARDILDGAVVIFVLTPLNQHQPPDVALIQSLFDLTPAEARVARGLAEGSNIAGLAKRFGVSQETVRSQVKSILSKTGVQRQAELVVRLGAVRKLGA